MNQALVDKITEAVLYEGYILYPYRPSVKNRQRWTFGGLYPRAYSEAGEGSDAWAMQTECLVQGSPDTRLKVQIRFLHLTDRRVAELEHPCQEVVEGAEPAYREVEKLQIGNQLLHSWQEAVERRYPLGEMRLSELANAPQRSELAFPATRSMEVVRDLQGNIAALLLRAQQALTGRIEVAAAEVAVNLFKVKVRIENHTPLAKPSPWDRAETLLHALVSTHTVLGVCGGEFVSLFDPPEKWRALAAACQNIGAWPVLVGQDGEKDTLLSTPIILYDYPQIAPESPGDLFDSTEIDEILTLRILTLTDEEKQSAAALDERARALLQRTEQMARASLQGLHGTMRRPQQPPRENEHD